MTSGEIKALVWDVDGVFVDTERLHFEVWQKLLTEHGGTLSIEEYRPLIGRSSTENMAEICARKGIIGDQVALNARRREIYGQLRRQGIPVISTNVKLVYEFAQLYPDLIQVAASNAIKTDLAENLAAAGLSDRFRFTVSSQDQLGLKRKPAPDLYHLVLQRLNLLADVCLAFEDTEHGVAAAKAAGLRVVALPSTLTTGQDFSAADLIIPPGTPRQAKIVYHKITALGGDV